MDYEMSEKLEAAFKLHEIQKCRDLVYTLITDFYYDENVTLKDILDITKETKENLIKIIDKTT